MKLPWIIDIFAGKLRRQFPDRSLAKQYLGWMKIGKTIRIYYGNHHTELVTMTNDGLHFHNLEVKK